MNIEIPETRYLSDNEKFIMGLKELLIKCRVQSYECNGFGILFLTFGDGSGIGLKRAFKETGFFSGLK